MLKNKLRTCWGILWPSGTAKTSLSRGMSTEGHSDRMYALVTPACPLLKELNIVENNNKKWKHGRFLLKVTSIGPHKLIWEVLKQTERLVSEHNPTKYKKEKPMNIEQSSTTFSTSVSSSFKIDDLDKDKFDRETAIYCSHRTTYPF